MRGDQGTLFSLRYRVCGETHSELLTGAQMRTVSDCFNPLIEFKRVTFCHFFHYRQGARSRGRGLL